jgi:hypothetical protein
MVASLGWPEEVFYRRLMSVVDDFGRFHASTKLLRSACYPLQFDKVSDADIGKWISKCETAGLVSVYPASDGKRYLQILKFGQQQRSKSKFPDPMPTANSCNQLLASAHLDVVGVGDGDGDVFEVDLKDEVPTVLGDLPAADPPSATVIEIATGKQKPPDLPFEQLVELYHQRLPACPRVQLLTEQRRRFAAARWRDWAAMDGWESQAQGLGEWAAFFDVVAKSKFLMGRTQSYDSNRPPFMADFDWLMRPTNFQKVFEGKYSEKRIAR